MDYSDMSGRFTLGGLTLHWFITEDRELAIRANTGEFRVQGTTGQVLLFLDHPSIFEIVDDPKPPEEPEADQDVLKEPEIDPFDWRIEGLGLPDEIAEPLVEAGVYHVGQVVSHTPDSLSERIGISPTECWVIHFALQALTPDLGLGMGATDWEPPTDEDEED